MEGLVSKGTLTLWFHENKDKDDNPSNRVYGVSNCHVLCKNTTVNYEHRVGARMSHVRVCSMRRFQHGLDEITKAIPDRGILADLSPRYCQTAGKGEAGRGECESLSIYGSGDKTAEAFSAKGGSGSLVWHLMNGNAHIVGQLHSGCNKGGSTSNHVTYCTPGWYLPEQIKKRFKYADFYCTKQHQRFDSLFPLMLLSAMWPVSSSATSSPMPSLLVLVCQL